MTDAPVEVDATAFDDDDELEPDAEVVDIFAGQTAGEPGSSPFMFRDEDWPTTAKPEPKEPKINPFQAKIDAMLATGSLPSRGVSFLAPEADFKTIRGQIQRAAGDRATAEVRSAPADEGKVTVKFRLITKRKLSKTTDAVDAGTTSGDQAD